MKKIMRNKGFTLVELLAVLVVLAILAVITIPVVTKVINKTKTSSYELSISSYGKAAENGIMTWAIEHQTGTYQVVDTWDDFQSIYGSFIETKGEEVTCTDAKVTKEGKLTLISCSTKDSLKENKIYSYAKGKTIFMENETSLVEYSIGNIISYKDIEWYVIENSNTYDDSVKLLKKDALTANEVNTYGNGYIYGGSSSNGSMAYYASDTCNSSDQSGCTTDYNSSQIKIVLDRWSHDKLDYNNLVEDENGHKIRLITKEEYTVINNPQNTWRGGNYWTMTAYNETIMYSVLQSGSILDCNGGNWQKNYIYGSSFLIRPVIELSKSAQFQLKS